MFEKDDASDDLENSIGMDESTPVKGNSGGDDVDEDLEVGVDEENLTPDEQTLFEMSKKKDQPIHETMTDEELQEMLKTEEEKQGVSAKDFHFDEQVYNEDPVTVQSVQFAAFEEEKAPQSEPNKNLDILMDIKLQLSVELGKTVLPIKKVLELTRGSIVELDKIAGEPVELYANGKLIAHGEVVVIEDNFGLRITSITDPDERLRGIQ